MNIVKFYFENNFIINGPYDTKEELIQGVKDYFGLVSPSKVKIKIIKHIEIQEEEIEL